MSLDARFTELRGAVREGWRGGGRTTTRLRGGRVARPRQLINSMKNQLLAMQMADRPTVVAALRRTGPRGRGGGNFINGRSRSRTRSPFTNGRSRSRSRSNFFNTSPDFRARSITPTRFRQMNSFGRMTRSQSMQSLASMGPMSLASDREMYHQARTYRGRVFTRSRASRLGPRGGIVRIGRVDRLGLQQTSARGGTRGVRTRGFNPVSRLTGRLGVRNELISPRRGRGAAGVRGVRGSRGSLLGVQGSIRGVQGSVRGSRGSLRGVRGTLRGVRGSVRGMRGSVSRGRGSVRRGRGAVRLEGRGRGGRGRGRGGRGGKPPTREDLDKELDSYMASTKTYLDRELDHYMSHPAEPTQA